MRTDHWNSFVSVFRIRTIELAKLKEDDEDDEIQSGLRGFKEGLTSAHKLASVTSVNTNPENAFILPPPLIGPTIVMLDYSNNQVYVNGSEIILEWSNNSSSFDLGIGAIRSGVDITGDFVWLLTNCRNFTQSFHWTVSTRGLPSGSIYYMTLIDTSSAYDLGDFDSHAFNISAKDTPNMPLSILPPVAPFMISATPISNSIPTSSSISASTFIPASSFISTSTFISTSSSISTFNLTATSLSSFTTKASYIEERTLGTSLGITFVIVLLCTGGFVSWFLIKRWKSQRLRTLAFLSKKQRIKLSSLSKQIRPPYELEGARVTSAPLGELSGDFRQPSELDAAPKPPGELYGGLRDPVELDGKVLGSENVRESVPEVAGV